MNDRCPIGDDVVDLALVQRTAAIGERFAHRVLSAAERSRIDASDDPTRALWRCWAAKEAAFKLGSQLMRGLAFAHARFEVTDDGERGRVCHPEFEAQIRWTESLDWLHAVAFVAEPPRWAGEVDTLADLAGASSALLPEELASSPHADSRAARALAHRLLDRLGAPAGLVLLRTGGPVEVRWREEQLGRGPALDGDVRPPWDVSLSHDGRFVSAAAATAHARGT